MLEANGANWAVPWLSIARFDRGDHREKERRFPMLDVLGLAFSYFSLTFGGFARGKTKALPREAMASMNFFLLCVSQPARLTSDLAARDRKAGVPLNGLASV
jgi:hypothetical protein